MTRNQTSYLQGMAAQLSLGIIVLTLTTLVCFRLGLDLATTGFVYLTLISLLSLLGSFVASAVLSVTAVACLNYFFTPPLFQARVDYLHDLMALIAFLTTSLVSSSLMARMQRLTELALQGEERILQAEKELRVATDTIPTLIWSTLPDGTADFVNRRWLEYTGLSAQEAQGWGYQTVIHPEDLAQLQQAWVARLPQGEPFEAELRLRRSDGEYRWFLNRFAPLQSELGNVIKWYGSSTDIEDRKRAEATLREQARLLDLTHDTVFVRDMDDVITYWNRGAEELYGWNAEEAIGHVTHRLLQTSFPEPLPIITDKLLRTSRWEGELVHTKRDGTPVVVASRWALQRDEADHPIAILETNNDITERKRTMEELARNQAYLAEAQKLSHTGSWVWNVASRTITHWSQELYRVFGFDPEGGMPSFETVTQRIHPDHRARVIEAFERGIREGADFEIDYRIVLPDGITKCIRSVGHPVFDTSGDLTIIGTNMDVSEHKQAEEERQAHLWFFESMDRINRAIQGTNDLEQMMSDVLDTVLLTFGCDRAWLAYPCDPEAASWHVVMEHTRPEFPGAFALGVDLPMDAEAANVFQKARASSDTVKFGPGSECPVPAHLAEVCDIQSLIGLAVYPKGGRPYMFGLHQCTYPRIWTPQEERLLQEIGRRLADALTSVLMLHNLRESEARLEEAQRIAHVGYWDRDLDTDLLSWSDETYRIFGLTPQERMMDFAGQLTLIRPEDRPLVTRAVAEALRGGPRYNVEYRIERPGGEVRIVHSQGNLMRDESGRPRRMFGTVQDITERKRAEEALRDSEEQWRAVFENNPTMYFMVDPSGMILSVNPFGAEQLGYAVNELIGQSVLNVFFEADREAVLRNASHCFEQLGRIISWELRKVRKDGSMLWVRETAKAVLMKNRPVILIVCEDITESKRAAEALREAQMELAHVNRVTTMGQLAASIAHEVNQPIAAVVTHAHAALRWLEAQPSNVAEVRQALDHIVKDGNRASEVIGRVRALIKKIPPRNDLLDINETILETISLIRSEIVRNGISLQTQLAEGMAPVQGDRVQLQQVILNLIMNAVEAMSGVEGRARTLLIRTAEDSSGSMLVSVHDSGAGLNPESLHHLFNAFYTTKPSGIGMGLPICRSIIEAHGGRLWARPNTPQGAVFEFTLPPNREITS